MLDRRNDNTGRPRSARSNEKIRAVSEVVEATPRISVRRVLCDVSNTSSKSTVHRILKYDLKLVVYKISLMQHLKDADISARLAFAEWVRSHDDITDMIWFSDESHFHLDGYMNKQNIRYWGSSKPEFYDERPLHSEKVTVWAAMSSSGLIGPFFYEENGECCTVNLECYMNLLQKKFVPELIRRGIRVQTCWFQQDGATPHTARSVLEWLEQTFGNRLFSLKTANVWPPHSPDMSPLDFYLWGYLKDNVYSPKPRCMAELKNAIRREMRKISRDTCVNVIRNFREHVELVRRNNGGHLEHIL